MDNSQGAGSGQQQSLPPPSQRSQGSPLLPRRSRSPPPPPGANADGRTPLRLELFVEDESSKKKLTALLNGPHASRLEGLCEMGNLAVEKSTAVPVLPAPLNTHAADTIGLKIVSTSSVLDGQHIAIPINRENLEQIANRY